MLFNNSFVCKRPPVLNDPWRPPKEIPPAGINMAVVNRMIIKLNYKMKLNEESTICDSGLILDTQYNTEFDGQEIIEEYKNGNIFGKQVPF